MESADGSLNSAGAAGAGAGVGVEGAFAVADEAGAGAGAAGGAGVWADAGAGVDGAALDDEAAGAALGCSNSQTKLLRSLKEVRKRSSTFDVMHTMKPFSSMVYDSTVFPSCRILPSKRTSVSQDFQFL